MSEKGIILIGPMGVGKSTIGELIAQRLQMPQRSMDEHRWDYYNEIGYDRDYAIRLEETKGVLEVCRYWKKFEIHAVERMLDEHKDSVIDFGAGHSVYEDEIYLERAKQALNPFKNVILLLPSPDKEHSLNVLNKRNNFESEGEVELNKGFIYHRSNYELAKQVVYTDGSAPECSVIDVLGEIGLSSTHIIG